MSVFFEYVINSMLVSVSNRIFMAQNANPAHRLRGCNQTWCLNHIFKRSTCIAIRLFALFMPGHSFDKYWWWHDSINKRVARKMQLPRTRSCLASKFSNYKGNWCVHCPRELVCMPLLKESCGCDRASLKLNNTLFMKRLSCKVFVLHLVNKVKMLFLNAFKQVKFKKFRNIINFHGSER